MTAAVVCLAVYGVAVTVLLVLVLSAYADLAAEHLDRLRGDR